MLKEILGTDYQGKVVCDCRRAYDFLGILQRCWAHLLRKAEDLKETLFGRYLYEKLLAMFKEIKRFNRRSCPSLSKHELFGIFASVPFKDVMKFIKQNAFIS